MKSAIIHKCWYFWMTSFVVFASLNLAQSQILLANPLPKAVAKVNTLVAVSKVHTVIINGMTFDPAEMHLKKGDFVTWENKDIVAHNITEFPTNRWNSGTLANGKSWKMKVDKSFDYYCSIHPTMKGKIVVDE